MALIPVLSQGWCVTLIFLMAVKYSKSDIMLNQFQSELGDWREKMPKIWHEYIRMYFYNFLQNKIHFLQGKVRHIIIQMMRHSKSLLLLSNKPTININVDLQMNNETKLCKLVSICLIYKSEWIYSYNQTKEDVNRCLEKQPIGQLFLHVKTWLLSARNLSISFAHWKLDSKMRLNLTFTTLCIPNAVLFCHPFGGSTSVSIISDYYCKYDFPLKFCGQYSAFSFYSSDTKVILCLGHNLTALSDVDLYGPVRNFIEHQIEGIFMIMDAGQLVNIQDVLLINPLIKPEFVYNINSKHILFRFLISVRKLEKIIINGSMITRYVVFDGPGFLSDTINTTTRFKITSTYQCLVLLLESREGSFRYFPKQLSAFNNISINQTDDSVFNFPNKKCNKGLCILLVNADVGFQLNVTAITVKSTMPLNVNCLYAGLVTGERLGSENNEARTICECDEGQARSFYTYKSTLIIVVYWYSVYSRINSSVMLSQTKCKPVIIDYCILRLLTTSPLSDLNKFSDIKFSYYILHLAYEINSRKCAVVQFLTRPTEFSIKYKLRSIRSMPRRNHKRCYFHFTPKNAVNILLRLSVNRSEISIGGKQIDVCKKIQSCPTNISEPLTPRIMLEYRELNRSIGILKDTSLTLEYKYLPTHEWIELVIQSVARNSVDQLNLSRFAIDFVFDKNRLNVYKAFTGLNTKSSILLLKSNSKSANPNASLTVNIILLSSNYYHKRVILTWESTFPWYQLKYKRYISLMGQYMDNMHLNWLEVYGFTPRNNVLMVMWINDNYISFSNIRATISRECYPKNIPLFETTSCLYTKMRHHGEYYYSIVEVLRHKYFHVQGKTFTKHKLKTWEEASNLCNDLVGGHLPIFNNKDRLHKFLSLLKLANNFFTQKIPGVYIGLKFNATNVSKINYVYFSRPAISVDNFRNPRIMQKCFP